MELYQLTAEKLSELLEKKECSSVELTQSVLDRIKAKDGEITFIRTTLILTVIWTVSIREYRLMRHLHLMII